MLGRSKSRREAYDQLARMVERLRDGDDLVARSRSAVAESFAILARVPEFSIAGLAAGVGRAVAPPPRVEEGSALSPKAWLGQGAETGLRFFFDVDDGEVSRRDEVGIALGSEGDVPRETRSILFDLAQASIPEGRPRLFTARVRDRTGRSLYEATMTMNPLPAVNDRRDEED